MVLYDSLHGNTEKIARAIGDGLSGGTAETGSVEVLAVGAVQPEQLPECDLLIVGGPTHGSRPSAPMYAFLKRIAPDALTGVRVAAFDTRTDMNRLQGPVRLVGKVFDRFGYAAPKILTALEANGGIRVKPPEGFIVLGTEGPLLEGELARAMAWGSQINT